MATRRLSIVRPAHPVASLNSEKVPVTNPSPKNRAGTANDPNVSQPATEVEQRGPQREAVRQALFQRKCNDTLKLPNGYLKVAVLIIRWDESIDDFPGHTEEIARLQDVFENSYGYTCKVHPINVHKKPQVDLNRAVLNHIYEHDDPNNLLIFYYTGHGEQHENVLELSANNNFMEQNGSHPPTALWHSAEEPILKEMAGDALSILDCCMASTAGIKCRSGLPRTYQLLAASAADAPTRGPGRNSFTTALCDALIELANGPEDGTFLLAQLCQRINTKRKLEACIAWDQTGLFKRTIQLHRLEQSPEMTDSFCNEEPEQSWLLLRLSFKTSDLEDGQIERLAANLPHACHEADAPLRRIDWVRMTNVEQTLMRTPSNMYRATPLGVDGTLGDTLFEFPDSEIFGKQPSNFYITSRTVSLAQKFRAVVRKRQASKHRRNVLTFIVLKLFALLFTFYLLYYRGEQERLVLSGFLSAYMIMYGPCKVVGFGSCVNGRNQIENGPCSNGGGGLCIGRSHTV